MENRQTSNDEVNMREIDELRSALHSKEEEQSGTSGGYALSRQFSITWGPSRASSIALERLQAMYQSAIMSKNKEKIELVGKALGYPPNQIDKDCKLIDLSLQQERESIEDKIAFLSELMEATCEPTSVLRRVLSVW